jgi:hypothetical protein
MTITRIAYPYRCYFYPGRDCPGWAAGGTCERIGRQIPSDEKDAPERGPWGPRQQVKPPTAPGPGKPK